jgi:hypothetical protein
MVVASDVVRPRWSAERIFYLTMAAALAVTVFVGFARSFFLRPLFPDWPSPSESIFYVHGAVFGSWYGLLVLQASLVTTGRVPLHRRVGLVGAGLAAAMVVLGTLGALIAAHRPTGFVDIPIPPLMFLAVPLADMVVFSILVTLAIAKRQDPQSHKRLMLIAAISLIAPALSRWPVLHGMGPLIFFGGTDLFLVPLLVWDLKSRGRLHPVTIWAGLLLVLSQPLRLALAGTPLWMSFARWAVGLVS